MYSTGSHRDISTIHVLPQARLRILPLLLRSLCRLIALLDGARASVNTGIVDEDIDMILILRDILHELLDGILVGYVCQDGNILAL